ncbi:hypothetical protein [Microbulbifer litoralis]|uniref:hypothetical protein n=1 Tax=Microbulbifer litoralis TaxID=2933965 RepID=UPI00202799B7|nr:hypothetical protein [Microbulbifer sp. GX H0434]
MAERKNTADIVPAITEEIGRAREQLALQRIDTRSDPFQVICLLQLTANRGQCGARCRYKTGYGNWTTSPFNASAFQRRISYWKIIDGCGFTIGNPGEFIFNQVIQFF